MLLTVLQALFTPVNIVLMIGGTIIGIMATTMVMMGEMFDLLVSQEGAMAMTFIVLI